MDMEMDLTTENITRLTKIHLTRYANRIRVGKSGDPYVDVAMCQHYLALWKEVEASGYDIDIVSKAAYNEVVDAVTSGE